MVLIDWDKCQRVGQDFMDQDHEETVVAINALWDLSNKAKDGDAAALDALKPAFDAFTDHLVKHFAREDHAMEATGFFAYDCHSSEHQRVLALMIDQEANLRKTRIDAFHHFLSVDLVEWFAGHLASMDAVTAQYLQAQGYRESDPTGS